MENDDPGKDAALSIAIEMFVTFETTKNHPSIQAVIASATRQYELLDDSHAGEALVMMPPPRWHGAVVLASMVSAVMVEAERPLTADDVWALCAIACGVCPGPAGMEVT